MKLIVPMSKNKPVTMVLMKFNMFQETSPDCPIKRPKRNSIDTERNQTIKCDSNENLPDNSIFLNMDY